MGSFVGFYGNSNIAADKFEEYMERIKKILDIGGMMSIEMVELAGKRVPLLAPPRLQKFKPRYASDDELSVDLEFWYNYFERDEWEGSCVSTKTGFYDGGKVGTSVFRCVSLAVNVLREFYGERPGLADNNGAVSGAGYIIAWFNYLFNEKWTCKRFLTIAQLYGADPLWNRDKPEIVGERVSSIDPNAKVDLLTITRDLVMKGDYGSLQELVDCELFNNHITITKCAFCFWYTLKHNKLALSEVMDVLMFKVVKPIKSELDVMNSYGHWLPVDLCAKILADYYEADYDTVKAELEPYFTRDNKAELYKQHLSNLAEDDPARDEMIETVINALGHKTRDWDDDADYFSSTPFAPLSTEDFLTMSLRYDDYPRTITGDDRAHWWSSDNDVIFSDDFQGWLQGLAGELNAIAAGGELPSTSEVLPLMMGTLDRAHKTFGHPTMFAETFYEIMRRAGEPRVKAAVVLLGQILDQSMSEKDDGTKIERYCAVLSNSELRKSVFKF